MSSGNRRAMGWITVISNRECSSRIIRTVKLVVPDENMQKQILKTWNKQMIEIYKHEIIIGDGQIRHIPSDFVSRLCHSSWVFKTLGNYLRANRFLFSKTWSCLKSIHFAIRLFLERLHHWQPTIFHASKYTPNNTVEVGSSSLKLNRNF